MMDNGYEDLGFAKVDHARLKRNGYPEVIFGEGKTPVQGAAIFKSIYDSGVSVICTRANPALAEAIKNVVPEAFYYEACGVIIYEREKPSLVGRVAVVTGGTADISVAEEAAVILEAYGSRVDRIYDVGVAGIHRLLSNLHILHEANCIIAVAGMEGALPSVVGGLVSVPVIAVPTNVGYGANFSGLAPLLAMLNSCAAGVSVVNIGNGFGAAYQADMINKMTVMGRGERHE